MATLVKHYGEQAARKLPPGPDKDVSHPLPTGKQKVSDQPRPGGEGSPKSVIMDRDPSPYSTYYSSCSSSSSAERAASLNLQQQDPLNRGNNCRDKPKWITPQHKESSALLESHARMDVSNGASTDGSNAQEAAGGSHNGFYDLGIQDMHFEFDPPILEQPQSLVATSTTQACKTSNPYELYVSKGLPLKSHSEDVNESKVSRYQASAPLNSLINTLMKQYQPSFLVDDGKTVRHSCLNEVFLDNVHNGGFHGDAIKRKFIASKWDAGHNCMHANLSSTQVPALGNYSAHKIPLLKLSHNDHTFPGPNVEQESLSVQHSYNKVHEKQQDASMWNKDTLKNGVEKLSEAVSCAQNCLERIHPIPPPTRNATTNPFLAQGFFQNRVYSMMVQGTPKPNSQVEPVIARAAHGNLHAPTTGTSGMELFWGSPIKADKQLTPAINHHLPAIQAPKKKILRPPAGFVKPSTIKDAECKGDLPNLGEHFRVQKHDLSGGLPSTTTSCMKDASTEITPTTSHRDIGTQMTPLGSLRHPSPHRSPQRGAAMSPPRRQNTPLPISAPPLQGIIDMSRITTLEVERCRRAKLELQRLSAQDQMRHSLGNSFNSNWSSREEEEEEIGKGLRHLDLEELKQDILDARATAWKEASRLKLLAKYAKEETKIQAWEELQASKAEADLKKLEMKLERKRTQMRTKIANRLDMAHKKAEERRAAAKAFRLEAMEKTYHRADEMRDEANFFQASYPLCACFSHSFG